MKFLMIAISALVITTSAQARQQCDNPNNPNRSTTNSDGTKTVVQSICDNKGKLIKTIVETFDSNGKKLTREKTKYNKDGDVKKNVVTTKGKEGGREVIKFEKGSKTIEGATARVYSDCRRDGQGCVNRRGNEAAEAGKNALSNRALKNKTTDKPQAPPAGEELKKTLEAEDKAKQEAGKIGGKAGYDACFKVCIQKDDQCVNDCKKFSGYDPDRAVQAQRELAENQKAMENAGKAGGKPGFDACMKVAAEKSDDYVKDCIKYSGFDPSKQRKKGDIAAEIIRNKGLLNEFNKLDCAEGKPGFTFSKIPGITKEDVNKVGIDIQYPGDPSRPVCKTIKGQGDNKRREELAAAIVKAGLFNDVAKLKAQDQPFLEAWYKASQDRFSFAAQTGKGNVKQFIYNDKPYCLRGGYLVQLVTPCN